MHPRFPKIRLARRIGRNVRPYALKLPAPNVLQILPLGRGRSRLVQVNRNLIPLPDFLSHMPRHGHAIFDGHALNRNERHHISRTHARMRPLMMVQVDQLRSLTDAANRSLLNRLALAQPK